MLSNLCESIHVCILLFVQLYMSLGMELVPLWITHCSIHLCYAWCIKPRGSVNPRLVCFAFKRKFKIMHISRGSSAYVLSNVLSTLVLIILSYMQILYCHHFTKKRETERTFIVQICFGIDDVY
jgi:hypothetical protein